MDLNATRLEPPWSSIKSNVIGAGLATVLSLALFFWVLFYFSLSRYIRFSVGTSLEVTTRHPLWLTFQSRVLGPYLIKAMSFGLSNNYIAAYICFQIAAVAIAGFLCWRLGRKYGGSDQSAFLALMIFTTCFVLLLSPPTLYSWDLIDLIVFAVFIDFVLSRSSLPWFVGLFAIAIWNRDSAFFIAFWLIFDPLVRWLYQLRDGRSRPTMDWHRIIAGIACIIVGLIIVHTLKKALSPGEIAHDILANRGEEYNFALVANLVLLRHSLFTPWSFVLVPFVPTLILLGATFVRLDPERYLAIYLVELSMLAGCFSFAWFGELRIYLILVPFIVISFIVVACSNQSIFTQNNSSSRV